VSGFTLLWGKILLSSIWIKESKETRIVWITLLALRDQNGIIQSSLIGLADAAKVSKEECQQALDIFLAPDPDDTSGVEEGRRIRVVPGGWQIVNHDLYRFSTEAKREFWKQQKADQRAKKKGRRKLKEQFPTTPPGSPDEQKAVKKFENGEITMDQLGDEGT